MSCLVCGHTMHGLGLEAQRLFWCPRCGTLKDVTRSENGEVLHETSESPKLVHYVQDAQPTSRRTTRLVSGDASYDVLLWYWEAICTAAGVQPTLTPPE